jgi:hypothetical protein
MVQKYYPELTEFVNFGQLSSAALAKQAVSCIKSSCTEQFLTAYCRAAGKKSPKKRDQKVALESFSPLKAHQKKTLAKSNKSQIHLAMKKSPALTRLMAVYPRAAPRRPHFYSARLRLLKTGPLLKRTCSYV